MTDPLAIPCNDDPAPRPDLVGPLLAEIAALLGRLAERGKPGAIDLRSLPLVADDLADLEAALGTGEISAELRVAGLSTVRETGHAGVWWIRHYGGNDEIAAEILEITRIPEILVSHPADIAAAARRLGTRLATASARSADTTREDLRDARP